MPRNTDNYDSAARNYRGKFGRMFQLISNSYTYSDATTPLAADRIAATPMIFSGPAIRPGGTFRIKQLQIFEDSASGVISPHKIPGRLILFTPADTSDVTGTLNTEFNMGVVLTWEDYAGYIDVLDTDYVVMKRGSEKVAIAIKKNVDLDAQTETHTRNLVGVFITKDDMTTKNILQNTKLHFTLSIQQD